MTELSDFTCTCGLDTHSETCLLMDCGAFTLGLVRWTGESLEPDPEFDPERLRAVATRKRRPGEPYNTTTFIPWTLIDRIDETIDYWIANRPDDPGPYNFSALGVTWVWNAAAAYWEAAKLECHCGGAIRDEDGYELCDRCQVIRKEPNQVWLQGTIGQDEATCRCVPPAVYVCSRCEVHRNSPKEPWDDESMKATQLIGCDHRLDEVFLEGVSLYASRFHQRQSDEDPPDWGVYLDKAWGEGDTIGALLPWTDFGLPRVPIEAVHGLCGEALRRAATEIVEVACLGGHGRTGTFLACCAVVAGMTPGDAITHVRDKYCVKAIETKKQEWYVHAMHAVHHNIPAPPMPVDPPTTWATTKEVTHQSSLLGQTPRCRDCHTSPLYASATTCDICGGPIE